jgi:hypothetical protein
MIGILVKLVISILTTMVVIASCIFLAYYFLMLFSFLFGMAGMYTVSTFFKNMASGLLARINRVFGIMEGK